MASLICSLVVAWACAFAEANAPQLQEKDDLVQRLKTSAMQLPTAKQEAALQIISEFATAEQLSDYSYGLQKAAPYLELGGVAMLLDASRNARSGLRYSRLDALLAAGIKLSSVDPEGSTQLNKALLDLALNADDFEKPIYAHAAAELAAVRCDKESFESASGLLPNPNSVRYAFWSARITGDTSPALTLIDRDGKGDDTREIRQAIDGYRLIHDFGYCSAAASPMAD